MMITPKQIQQFQQHIKDELHDAAFDGFDALPTAVLADLPETTPEVDIPKLVRHLEKGGSYADFDPKAPLRLINETFKRQIPYIPEFRVLLSPSEIIYLTHLLWYFSKNANKQTQYAIMNSSNTARHLRISTKSEQRIRGVFKAEGILESKYLRGPRHILIHVNIGKLQEFVEKLIAKLAEIDGENPAPLQPVFQPIPDLSQPISPVITAIEPPIETAVKAPVELPAAPIEHSVIEPNVETLVIETPAPIQAEALLEAPIIVDDPMIEHPLSWDKPNIYNKTIITQTVRPFITHDHSLIHHHLLGDAKAFFGTHTPMRMEDVYVGSATKFLPYTHELAPLRRALGVNGDVLLRTVLEDYKEAIPGISSTFPKFYFTKDPLSARLEMELKPWQVAWFKFTEILSSNLPEHVYLHLLSWMHPLHIDPKPMGRIILATPTRGTMLLLSKIFADTFGVDTRDRHISIKVVEAAEKVVHPKVIATATDTMSDADWDNFLGESVPLHLYAQNMEE